MVAYRANWLNYDGCTFIVSKDVLCDIKAACFFLSILFFVLPKRILQLWEFSLWPWESRKTMWVSISSAYRKSSGRLSMVAVVKSNNTNPSYTIKIISSSIVTHCSGNSCLVSISAGWATKEYLISAGRSSSHNFGSNNIGKIMRRKSISMYLMGNKSIV